MAEKSILDMTNEEIIAMVQRNKVLREAATQEKAVAREKETIVKSAKVEARASKDAAMDILKNYLDSIEGKAKK